MPKFKGPFGGTVEPTPDPMGPFPPEDPMGPPEPPMPGEARFVPLPGELPEDPDVDFGDGDEESGVGAGTVIAGILALGIVGFIIARKG